MNILEKEPPSEFLRHIHELNASGDISFIKNLFFSCLPNNMQIILINIVNTSTINKIITSAKLRNFNHCPTTVDKVVAASFSSPTTQPTSTDEDATLRAIEHLTHKVISLCNAWAMFQHHSQSRSSFHCFSGPIATSSTIVPLKVQREHMLVCQVLFTWAIDKLN